MADKISSHSSRNGGTLSELGDNYLRLLGGDADIGSRSQDSDDVFDRNYQWTRVVSTEHFRFRGCQMSLVNDDANEAWAEINSLAANSLNSWEFVFNADEHRLPSSETDLNLFRFSDDELLVIGKQVTRLREHVNQRVATIAAYGHAEHVPLIPSELDERSRLEVVNQEVRRTLAAEENQLEQSCFELSSKYRRRRMCELS